MHLDLTVFIIKVSLLPNKHGDFKENINQIASDTF